MPNGTVVWTAPSGKTFVTHPGSRIFFPKWDTTTAPLPPPTKTTPVADRGLMMPTRQRTRAADRAHSIDAERALNDEHVAERDRPPPF